MNKVKNAFFKVASFLGFKKNSPYVNAYIHRANIRSGLFMSAVVAILETWLVIRQHDKYIIRKTFDFGSYWDNLFKYTSLFWLQMVMGIAMFLYCLYLLSSNKKNKPLLISILVTYSIGIGLCSLIGFENAIKNFDANAYISNSLLIALYCMILLFHIMTIVASILRYRGKHYEWLHSVTIITIFATCLLIFGIRVSYTDFTSLDKNNPSDVEISWLASIAHTIIV